MNFNKLSPDKLEFVQRIRRNEIEAKFSEVKKTYLEVFCRENAIEYDFKVLCLMMPDGTPSGLAKCTKCEESFQEQGLTSLLDREKIHVFSCKSKVDLV